MILAPFPTAYSSSAPGIATVSGDGVVTGVAPGTATITTTVTIGSVSQVATTAVTVAVTPFDYWQIAGIYDLTATVTLNIDPLGWNGNSPYQYTGVLRFSGDAGTFTNVRLLDGGGEPVFPAMVGSIALEVPRAWDLFALRLGTDWVARAESVEKPDENALSSPLIKGTLMGSFTDSFGTWGLTGPFVATLRQ